MEVQTEPQVDRMKLNRLVEEMKSDQNLSMGILGGIIAALLGAIAWGAFTFLTGYQIGFMALGVGFLVGYAVRQFGHGVDKSFGVSGALLSLLGCLMGNLFAACIFISREMGLSLYAVISGLNAGMTADILAATFQPMDLLFYFIAVYEGYRFSFKRLSNAEIASLMAK